MTIYSILIPVLLAACGLEQSKQEKSKSESDRPTNSPKSSDPGTQTKRDSVSDAANKSTDSKSTSDSTSGTSDANGNTGGSSSVEDSLQEIQALISSGAYLKWRSEAAPHQSVGPHGIVRSFVNETLFESLKKGNTIHPLGSTAVKELYDNNKNISGYAVEIKSSEGSGASTWTWYEDFNRSSQVDFYGKNLSACTSCHSRGIDYVTTSFDAFL